MGLWKCYLLIIRISLSSSTGMVLFFGLPLLLSPIRWARLLNWQIPEHTDLSIYFGRCLGAVICVMAYLAYRVIPNPVTQIFYFELLLWSFAAMVLVHLYGAIKKIQSLRCMGFLKMFDRNLYPKKLLFAYFSLLLLLSLIGRVILVSIFSLILVEKSQPI